MYYILEMDADFTIMASFTEAHPGHDLKWLQGRRFDEDERPERLEVVLEEQFDEHQEEGTSEREPSPPTEYPDFFELMRVPIGSRRLRDVLLGAGVDNLDYHPVRIVERSGRVVEGFYAINVIGRVDGVDRDASQLVTDDDKIVRIDALALKEQAIHDLKVFRLDGYPEILVVDQAVADGVRSLAGVRISPAQGWNDDHRF